MRAGAPGQAVSLEAQVMDWADDVAYSVHDLDDAIQLRWFEPRVLTSPDEQDRIVARCLEWYLPGADPAALGEALNRITAVDYWVPEFDGRCDRWLPKRMTRN
jgi:dGTPase